MRALGASRISVAPGGTLIAGWVKNELWRRARAVPSLDLRFADNKSLVDATTGQNLVSFTRASSGTYVDSQGVIRTATTNLLLRSEEFGTTWGRPQSDTISADSIAAPTGAITADSFVENLTASSLHTLLQDVTIAANATYTFSLYVKAALRTEVRMNITDAGDTNGVIGSFNLSTGTATSSMVGSGSGAVVSIQALSGGWYRCVISGTLGGSITTTRLRIRPLLSGSDVYNGSGQTALYIWGAQLEQSSTVGEYIPTTSTINSAPRFDHNPTTGESLGLLVEESRTNLALNSATFQPTSGGAPAAYTVDQVAPDGTTTGSRQTAANPRTFVEYTGIANALYTFSFYCRVTSGTAGFSIQLKNAATDTVIASDTSPVATTAWRRFTISGTTTGATTGARLELTGVAPGFVLWGAQLEAGAFPTSYIPTTTAAATRSADVASISGSNFSSWYRADEGSLFTDCSINYTVPGTAFPLGASINDGTSNNRIENGFLTASLAGFEVTTSGVAQAAIYPNAGSTLTRRLTTSFRLNDFAASLNGGAVNTDTSGTVPAVDRLRIGDRTVGNNLNGTIRRLTYWPQRLSNSTLASITQ